MIALRDFIGAGCGVQDVVILPRVGEAEVFRGALLLMLDGGASFTVVPSFRSPPSVGATGLFLAPLDGGQFRVGSLGK